MGRKSPLTEWSRYLLIACCSLPVGFHSAAADDDSCMVARLRHWAGQHNIDLVTEVSSLTSWPEGIEGRQASSQELSTYAALLYSELALYPPEVFKKLQLRLVVLCSDLAVDQTPRGGVVFKEDNVLFLEAARGVSYPSFRKKTIHHELFHMLDVVDSYREDGLVYADQTWAALNSGGDDAYQGETDDLRKDLDWWRLSIAWPGFLTHYSIVDVGEDKAEVFANMMTLPVWIDYVRSRDEVVNRKIVRMKSIAKRFCGCLDDAFWERIEQHRAQDDVNLRIDGAQELLRRRAVEE